MRKTSCPIKVYCFACICNVTQINGQWMPFLQENLSSRHNYFLSVVQARTVAEAVGHAQRGFQHEGFLKGSTTPATPSTKPPCGMPTVDSEESVKKMKTLKRKISLPIEPGLEQQNCKENVGREKTNVAYIGEHTVNAKLVKRRRLQPLSLLCLKNSSESIDDTDDVMVVQSDMLSSLWKRSDVSGIDRRHAKREERKSLAHLLTSRRT
eukprot:c17384_g1_i2 orf=256-882(+)